MHTMFARSNIAVVGSKSSVVKMAAQGQAWETCDLTRSAKCQRLNLRPDDL